LPTVRRIESDPDHWRLEQILELRRQSEELCPGGWPILALRQFRKSLTKQTEPTVEDLLGGAELAYKAKRVFFLLPDAKADASKPVVPVTLAIKKARHARMERLPLKFHHAQFRFEETQGTAEKGSNKTVEKPSRPSSNNKCSSIDPLAGMEA